MSVCACPHARKGVKAPLKCRGSFKKKHTKISTNTGTNMIDRDSYIFIYTFVCVCLR